MKNAVVRARIDSKLKAYTARVLAACGLEPSDAIGASDARIGAPMHRNVDQATDIRKRLRRQPKNER